MDKKAIATIVLAIAGLAAAYFGLDLTGCKVADKASAAVEALAPPAQ